MSYSTQEFAGDLKRRLDTEVIDAVRATLEKPAGRLPEQKLVQRSEWYKGLNDSDKEMVLSVASYAADLAVFSVLGILDGADVLSNELDGFDLRLTLVKDREETLLSSSRDYQGLQEHFF